MKLVERDCELSVLAEQLDLCSVGHGGLAVASGVVGSGKTALLKVPGERTAGGIILSATASRAERALPLGVVDQLLVQARLSPENQERAARLLRAGALAAPLRESEPDAFDVQVLRGIGKILLSLTERSAVVITVDDVHNSDVPSLECLLYMARRLEHARILVVLASCTSYPYENSPLHGEFLRLPYCRHINVKLLSLSGVAEMLAADLGERRADRLAETCLALTGGSPLLIRALIGDCRAARADGAELVPGQAFSQAVVASIYRAAPAALETARAVAILNEHASPAVISEFAGLSLDATTLAINALTSVGLLDSTAFRHDAVRAAVLLGLDPDQRAAMNAQAARVLQSCGVAPAKVALHLVASDGLDAPWKAQVLREAAKQALADNEVGPAISYLRAAYKACADERQRTAIRALLLRAEWRVSPSSASQHLADLTQTALEHRLTGADAAAVGAQLLWHGRTDQAMDVLEAVCDGGPPASRVPGFGAERIQVAEPGSALNLVWPWLSCCFPDLAGQRKPPQIADGGRPIAWSTSSQGAELLRGVLSNTGPSDPLGRAEAILQGPLLSDGGAASAMAALAALIYINRPDQARAWCDAFFREATTRRVPAWQGLFAAIRSVIDIRQGNLVSGEKSARSAMTYISPQSWGVGIGIPIATLLHAMTAQGRYEEAAACLTTRVPDSMLQTIAGPPYLHARGRFYLAIDRPRAALDDFYLCSELLTKWDIDLPAFVPWRTDAAQALIRLGDHCESRELAAKQISMLRSADTWARGISLRVLAGASQPNERLALLTEAVSLLEEFGDTFELALTAAELGCAYLELGDEDQARVLARRARRLAETCGAVLPSDASLRPEAETAPAALAEEVSGVDRDVQLSDAQLRVATLAAQGHTNRQIADMLYITVSTVEQHLTQVYRKLQTNRRADLRTELLRRKSRVPLSPHVE